MKTVAVLVLSCALSKISRGRLRMIFRDMRDTDVMIFRDVLETKQLVH